MDSDQRKKVIWHIKVVSEGEAYDILTTKHTQRTFLSPQEIRDYKTTFLVEGTTLVMR